MISYFHLLASSSIFKAVFKKVTGRFHQLADTEANNHFKKERRADTQKYKQQSCSPVEVPSTSHFSDIFKIWTKPEN